MPDEGIMNFVETAVPHPMTTKKSTVKKSGKSPRSVSPPGGATGNGLPAEENLRQLRHKAERRLSERVNQLDELSSRDVAELVQELGTHQIELDMQNEELRRLQRQLEESQRRYADLFDFAPVGYFSLDRSGTISAVNLTGAGILGISRSALLGASLAVQVLEEDRGLFYRHLEELLESNGSRSCEVRMVSGEGEVRFFGLESLPVTDDQGRIIEVRTTINDISKRLRTEQSLLSERSVLETIMDTTEALLVYLDQDFNFLRVNEAYARTCNMRPEEMIGRNHFELFPHPENEAVFRQVRDTGRPVSYRDKPFVFPNQPERGVTWWDWTLSPVKGQDDRVEGLVFSLNETTEKKAVEEELRKNQNQLQAIFDNLDEGVIIFDREGKDCRVNAAMAAISGFSSREEYYEAVPRFDEIFELSTRENGVLGLEEWPHNRVLKGEVLHNFEVNVQRRNKNWRRVFSYSGKLMQGGEGYNPHVILTISDVTERHRAEEKIRLRNRVLQGIKDIFESGLFCVTDRELAEKALEIAKQITGSRLGFIGEIGPDDQLREIALCRESEAACTMGRGPDSRPLFKRSPFNGLLGKVLNEGTFFFTNEPARHPAAAGQPEGHPSLASFLGVPLKHNGKTIGIIALGNRPGGYGKEERQSVEILAPAFLETMFKNRVQRELVKSEARQRRQAEELNQLLQLTPIPMWIAHDPHCHVVTGNLAATTLLGVGPGENLSQTPEEGGKRPRVQHYRNGRRLSAEELPLQYAVAHKIPVRDTEMEMVLPNGQVRSMLGGAVPLLDEEGLVQGGIAVYMDITVRRQMEERINQAKVEWERTFDSVPDLIAILDHNFRFRRVNRSMADRLGREPQECVNMTCYELIDHATQRPELCPVMKTLQTGDPQVAEKEYAMLDGIFLVSSTPLFNEEEELIGTVLVARDITEVKKAQNLLEKGESRLKRAQQIAQLGSWEFEQQSGTLIWSDELYRILGMEPRECRASYKKFLQLIHPDEKSKVEDAYRESLRQGWKNYELEHRIVQHNSGNIRYVHSKCEYIRDANGALVRTVGMLHDITERRQAELRIRQLNKDLQHYVRQLAIANQELERSNQDLQQFAYIASHDLQEPLRTVSSFVQLLSRRYKGQLDDKADTYINFAVEGTSYMHSLLQGLLAFSRAGGDLRVRTVDLQQMIEKLMRTLQWKLEETGGRLEASGLPVVEADETQLFQVLQNLVANALKFHGNDPPRIHIWTEHRESEWQICIRDNGIGIDPHHAERIFLIFQRLHRKEEYEGTGIGLAVCKRIIERHGGRIWVESTPGQGSLFCFTLPEKKEG